MRLQVANKPNSCSIPEPHQSESYSLHSDKLMQPIILLIPDDRRCDIEYKILKAKDAGYGGVIFYADSIDQFRKISPIKGFYVSVILCNDGFLLAEYSESL